MRFRTTGIIAAAVTCTAHVVLAQTTLIRDINQLQSPRSSDANPIVSHGKHVFFVADDGLTGKELWVSDGTPGGTHIVVDAAPGRDPGLPFGLRIVGFAGDNLLLSVASPDGYTELWVSNPPYVSAQLFRDIEPVTLDFGTDASLIERSAALPDGRFLFVASTPSSGVELWITDGGSAGTSMVVDLQPGPGTSWPTEFELVGNTVYFVAAPSSTGGEIWRTDGTAEGTVLHAEVTPGPVGSVPTSLTWYDGRLYFAAAGNGFFNRELWRTDGTPAGTEIVHDIYPGTFSSNPKGLNVLGDRLLFFTSGASSVGLYSTNGQPGGLTFLASAPVSNYAPNQLVVLDGIAYFAAASPAQGVELWRTDGTPAGTHIVKDLDPGTPSTTIYRLSVVGSRLFFLATSTDGRTRLWTSDGTDVGTLALREFASAQTSPQGVALAHLGDSVLFGANAGPEGSELWISNGTAAGTTLLADISPARGTDDSGSSMFTALTEARQTATFAANDSIHGQELWRTDGAAGGTSLVLDINAGPASSSIRALTRSGSVNYFYATDAAHGVELWKTDGLPTGTSLVADLLPGPGPLTRFDYLPMADLSGTLYFAGQTVTQGIEPWKTSGTAGSTLIVQNIGPSTSGSNPSNYAAAGGWMYFAAPRENALSDLWSTNGTTVLRIGGSIPAGGAHVTPPAAVPGGLLFVQSTAATGFELFRTAHGTGASVLVVDIVPGSTGSDPRSLTASGNRVFFTADDSLVGPEARGRELWVTDGTAPGTRIVRDLIPGERSSRPFDLTDADDILFFTAFSPESGRELWITDGTDAGTRLVKDINPGAASSRPSSLMRVGRSRIVFAAFTPEAGVELWESDGTESGTHMVADILPGALSSSPREFLVMQNQVIFVATDAEHGQEPWVYHVSTAICRCDWNDTSTIDSNDFFAFLTSFFTNEADFDFSGATDTPDFFAFLECYFGGCP